MYFNEPKYKKCIKHLIGIKTSIVISYIIIFTLIGAAIGYPIMEYRSDEWSTVIIAAIVGAIIGLAIGIFSTWRIEMRIQESYLKIDVINELQKQTSLINKINTSSKQPSENFENTTTKS